MSTSDQLRSILPASLGICISLDEIRFLEVVKELEQNEEDLVSEIKNLAREKQALEIRNNDQRYDKFNLQMKNTELSRLCDNSDSELDIVRKKFEVEQKKNKECMM